MSSEFGVPRESTAWRTRGPPTAVNEAGTQYLAILSQPHSGSCSATGAFFSNPTAQIRLPCRPLRVPLLTPGNMLLCFVPHFQPGTGTAYLVTVIQLAHTKTSGMRVHGYLCVPLYFRMGAWYVSRWPGVNGKRERTKATG